MKVCKICNLEKEFNCFNIKKNNKDGLNTKCKLCEKEYNKSYYSSNTEYFKEHNKKWNEDNRLIKNEKAKSYYIQNKELCSEKSKIYRDNNRDKLNTNKRNWEKNRPVSEKRIYRNYYNKVKKDTDSLYKLKCNTRSYLSMILRKFGFEKNNKSIEIIGISFEGFKLYLESRFEDWMNWDNRGLYNGELNYGWDIDHIIPISSAKTEDDIIKLNHYSNLQPLCSKINRDIKKDKY
jgi:hypothetical protein